MKSPFIKTLIMAGLACAVTVGAAAVYPWPEAVVQSDLLNKPLFESYDTSTVRKIRIVKYDLDRNAIDQIVLERSGEKWTIPARRKFVANNLNQIANTTKALNELTVLEEVAGGNEAFLDFRVVDPSKYESQADKTALGTKLILEDRKGRDIASLIVGAARKDDSNPGSKKHFVRIPDQPTVFVVDFDDTALSTKFDSWVDSNLLGLQSKVAGLITIDDYRVSQTEPKLKTNYQSKIIFRDPVEMVTKGGSQLVEFQLPDEKGEMQKMELTSDLRVQFQKLNRQIGNIRYPDVQRKSSKVAKAIRLHRPSQDLAIFDSIKKQGFNIDGMEHGAFKFESVNGQISLRSQDGVLLTMYIGDVAKNAVGGEGRLSLHVMMIAGVDETMVPMPPKPDDENDKEYLRSVQQRKEMLKSAKTRASELNQLHSDWFYLVPENVIEAIRPAVLTSELKPLATDTETPAEKKSEPATEKPETKKPDPAATEKPQAQPASEAAKIEGPAEAKKTEKPETKK